MRYLEPIARRLFTKRQFDLVAEAFFAFRALPLAGTGVTCPCCERSFRQFLSSHSPPGSGNGKCPRCASWSRHRAMWLYMTRETDLLQRPQSVLHFGPELILEKRMMNLPHIDYLSADIESPPAMVAMDIQHIQYPDASLDAIICCHVLEHVDDDRKAMSELYRVLKPGGWALLLVPLNPSRADTYEDSSIVSPKAREQAFGQWDHVRLYGRDYFERLEQAGFQVEALNYGQQLSPDDRARYVIRENEPIYIGRKEQ